MSKARIMEATILSYAVTISVPVYKPILIFKYTDMNIIQYSQYFRNKCEKCNPAEIYGYSNCAIALSLAFDHKGTLKNMANGTDTAGRSTIEFTISFDSYPDLMDFIGAFQSSIHEKAAV